MEDYGKCLSSYCLVRNGESPDALNKMRTMGTEGNNPFINSRDNRRATKSERENT